MKLLVSSELNQFQLDIIYDKLGHFVIFFQYLQTLQLSKIRYLYIIIIPQYLAWGHVHKHEHKSKTFPRYLQRGAVKTTLTLHFY